MLCMLMHRVDVLWSRADVAGASTPITPRMMSPKLKLMTKR